MTAITVESGDILALEDSIDEALQLVRLLDLAAMGLIDQVMPEERAALIKGARVLEEELKSIAGELKRVRSGCS